jgi:hypothetical protein
MSYDITSDKNDTNLYVYNDKSNDRSPPAGIDGKPRIVIIMLNSPNIHTYAHCATMNNYLYATKHGYDFIVERTPLDLERDWTFDKNKEYVWVWYKAELLKRHLKNYHYILFIDSDATFINFDYSIENEVIKRFDDDFSIMFQEDIWSASWARNNNNVVSDKICTGLIFVKNSTISFDILDIWIRSAYNDPDCIKWRYLHAREQSTINILRDKYDLLKQNIKIFPAYIGLFGQYDSKWILHLAGKSPEHRHYVLGNILKQNIGMLNTKN